MKASLKLFHPAEAFFSFYFVFFHFANFFLTAFQQVQSLILTPASPKLSQFSDTIDVLYCYKYLYLLNTTEKFCLNQNVPAKHSRQPFSRHIERCLPCPYRRSFEPLSPLTFNSGGSSQIPLKTQKNNLGHGFPFGTYTDLLTRFIYQ